MRDVLSWTWLSVRLGAASPYLNPLLEHFAAAADVYAADHAALAAVEGLPESVRLRLLDKDTDRAERILEDCRRLGIGVMTYDDPRYPRLLKQIAKPPAVLYFVGKPIDFDRKLGVAVVGTRTMTEYGRDVTYRFSYDLASAGAVIVSGMALGVDGMAAAGSLDAQMPTAVVLGSGLDVVYPKMHTKLYKCILRDGFAVSEYPPGAEPDARNFPQRNRIISGLARCVLVTECPETSGALITAREALAEGKPLFAVPGAITMPGSAGTNELIKSGGAKMVTSPTDILDLFEPAHFPELDASAVGAMNYNAAKAESTYAVSTKTSKVAWAKVRRKKPESAPDDSPDTVRESSAPKVTETFVPMSETEKKIYACIPEEGQVSVDLIAAGSGAPVPDVLTALLALTCKGVVRQLPGNFYTRV
ncbi:MAG: DNA-protecting protein DprA [Oscillospiraceae bacterium]|nr:MAG: DNA-protecting protein DprA [Oscillospiraceae bacterium]